MSRFILDGGVVLEQYNKLLTVSDIVSYSYKTNPQVASVLERETGCMFSVHSIEDMSEIKDKSRIWYFLQAADKEQIQDLAQAGITHFVVDNTSDLDVLKDFLRTSTKKLDVLLRMRLKEHTIHTGKHFVYGLFSSQINDLIPRLRDMPSVGKLGIHFHRKTQNTSEWSMEDELSDALSEQTFSMIDFVNIGGGIPSVYKNFREEIVEGVLAKIRRFHGFLSKRGIRMMIEPGRFIAAPSVVLEAEIKSIYNDTIIVDCSVFNSAMDTFIANIRLLVEGELDSGKRYTIKGCTPDSMDIFRYSVFLDPPNVGDKIRFLNAGAYNFSCDFCNLQKIRTELV